MEIFFEEIKIGDVLIQVSIQEGQGCRMMITAKDQDNRRILKTPVMENGEIKVYETPELAIEDARKRFGSMINAA
jgi:hypothetical protein